MIKSFFETEPYTFLSPDYIKTLLMIEMTIITLRSQHTDFIATELTNNSNFEYDNRNWKTKARPSSRSS